MTELEKMAKEAATFVPALFRLLGSEHKEHHPQVEKGYLEGFRAARQMAIEMTTDRCIEGNVDYFLSQLGEKEIDPDAAGAKMSTNLVNKGE